MSNQKVAVLIPCYNEELTVAKVVSDFRAVLPEAEIYVYDNNSTDRTSELAVKAGAMVRKEEHQGKGNVVRTMFREIDADAYILVDGDDTYPAEEVHVLLDPVLNEGWRSATVFRMAPIIPRISGHSMNSGIIWYGI